MHTCTGEYAAANCCTWVQGDSACKMATPEEVPPCLVMILQSCLLYSSIACAIYIKA